MKKILFVFAFMGMFAMVSEAQTKSCTKSCAKVCDKKTASAESSAASKAASLDASIETRTDASTNESYYVRKVSGTGGNVSYDKVEYCSKEGKFVNVSPKGKACCAKEKSGAACCAKKGSTTADATSK